VAISLSPTLCNTRANAITTALGASAKLRLYTAAYAVLLAECVCDATAFAPAAVAGVLTVNAISPGTAAAAGDAALARLYRSDGTTLEITGISVSDSAGAGDLKLSQTGVAITSGQSVVVDSLIITEGNV
jgi:hypothetical protein